MITYGTVFMTEFSFGPNGESVRGFTGTVETRTAESMLGHKVNARDSNWCVSVTGKTTTMWILGCKVERIMEHSDSFTPAATCRVP